MNYELAKKLKDAGFPQKERLYPTSNDSEDGKFFCAGTENQCYRPTLSELIDFIDGNGIMKEIENDYAKKALYKLQKNKDERPIL